MSQQGPGAASLQSWLRGPVQGPLSQPAGRNSAAWRDTRTSLCARPLPAGMRMAGFQPLCIPPPPPPLFFPIAQVQRAAGARRLPRGPAHLRHLHGGAAGARLCAARLPARLVPRLPGGAGAHPRGRGQPGRAQVGAMGAAAGLPPEVATDLIDEVAPCRGTSWLLSP